MTFFYYFGQYLLLLVAALRRPDSYKVFFKRIIIEMDSIGVGSVGIVAFVSIFIGAVTTVNTAYQLTNPFVPSSTIGMIVAESYILEFGPTITGLVLAGKIGSSIATQIGTMRINEQIDALDVMGVNSANYLILPKISGGLVMIPMLLVLSMFLGITSGMVVGSVADIVSTNAFLSGARAVFKVYTLVFALGKCFTFAFLITSISSYFGYFTTGGATGVGVAGTQAVVYSCIFILFFDYVLAQVFL